MSRPFPVLLVVLANTLLVGCGGDDSVNPTNPDAQAPKSGDASSDHDAAKLDSSSDGPKASSDAPAEGAGDHDGAHDASLGDGPATDGPESDALTTDASGGDASGSD
jgi:hypothetical protein